MVPAIVLESLLAAFAVFFLLSIGIELAKHDGHKKTHALTVRAYDAEDRAYRAEYLLHRYRRAAATSAGRRSSVLGELNLNYDVIYGVDDEDKEPDMPSTSPLAERYEQLPLPSTDQAYE